MTKLGISLRKVGVTFSGHITGNRSIKTYCANLLKRNPNKETSYELRALHSINLDIQAGERVGLIGLNGAGKSTMLKVMARIYPVTTGNATIIGKVCPMFEFATGFEMNQTGYDNIKIRGTLLGMHRSEIEEKMREIAEFSELGKFLDYPVRTYSSGMFVRLAFSVSTAVNPEILLLDEVMGAGDKDFSHKAQMRMHTFMEQGKILVFSSHAPDLIREYCDRVIWLEKGQIKMDGTTKDILKHYTQS